MPGRLYLLPTPLDFGTQQTTALPVDLWLPRETLEVAARLGHWITENAKSTRAFLKRVDQIRPLSSPIQGMHIVELPRESHKKGDHAPGAADQAAAALLAPALQGYDVGLVSEAGMPAIADPGSAVVRAAHQAGLAVVPLTGPVSLMLALAASGLNGQGFAFVGYVPQSANERAQRLRELDAHAQRTGQTQILIETPYRNEALLDALLATLNPNTRLAVACGLGLPEQTLQSALVRDWKNQPARRQALALGLPAVFLFGR